MDYIGCDSHHDYCSFQHISSDGALGLIDRVDTERDQLFSFLDQLDEEVILTMEASGEHFWLSRHFATHPSVNQVKVLNPRSARKLADELASLSGYGRSKTDRIDAEMLAQMTRLGLIPEIYQPTMDQAILRHFTRHRLFSVCQRTRLKNRAHGILRFFGVDLASSQLFSSNRLPKDVRANEYFPEPMHIIVDDMLEQIHMLNGQIERCDKTLGELLPMSDTQMRIVISAPGIGEVLSRIVIAEIMDITRFNSPKYLKSYAGLSIFANESGKHIGKRKLNQHCNYWLKYALIEAAHHAKGDVKYKRKYNLDAKKFGKKRAKINLARRLTNAIYWMLTRQQPFCYSL